MQYAFLRNFCRQTNFLRRHYPDQVHLKLMVGGFLRPKELPSTFLPSTFNLKMGMFSANLFEGTPKVLFCSAI